MNTKDVVLNALSKMDSMSKPDVKTQEVHCLLVTADEYFAGHFSI